MTRDERLLRLEEHVVKLGTRLNLFAEQVAEQNLRVRFIMSTIELARPVPGGLVGADGHPQIEKTDLFVQYMTGGREQMLDALEKEHAEVQAVMRELKEREADGEDSSLGGVPGEGEGGGEGEERPGDHQPAAGTDPAERADRQPLRPNFAHRTL